MTTICLYFVLMTLYAHVFSEMGVSKQVRGGAMLLLAGTAGVSYYMVAASSDRLITHFVVELGQNLYFVGVLLTYLLWGAMVKLRENRTRLMQIVLSMGVYLSLFAGSYALGNLYPNHVDSGGTSSRHLGHVAAGFLGLHIPESSRRRANRHSEGTRSESMMAVMIFVISILTLLQFFVSYSRSLIAESRGHELSEQAREICGLTARTAAGDQFRRLSQLIALCPGIGRRRR